MRLQLADYIRRLRRAIYLLYTTMQYPPDRRKRRRGPSYLIRLCGRLVIRAMIQLDGSLADIR